MMGSFLLVRVDHDGTAPDVGPALSVFADQGLPAPTKLIAGRWTLYALPYLADEAQKPNIIEGTGEDFAAAFGTLLYRGKSGQDGLRILYADYRTQAVDWDSLVGCYCVILSSGNDVTLFTDQGGSFKAYANRDKRVISSSFLVVAAMAPQRTLDRQAACEYVFQGTSYGWRTALNEVSLLKGARRYILAENIKEEAWPFALPTAPLALSFDDHVAKCVAALDDIFDPIAQAFGAHIDTALSGGYDSRLILALLRRRGITPRLHVYGHDGDADVLVAKAIAAGEGLDLLHEDKSGAPEPSVEESAELAARNYVLFDGLPTDGIFSNGRDFASRCERVSGGHVALNGGGGEIFRNFFYLPDRNMPVRDLIRSFYCQFDPRACSEMFSEQVYLREMGTKILFSLGRSSDDPLQAMLSRTEVELLYPLFRGQFWAARNTSVNNRIGPALTPFMEPLLTQVSAETPLRFKNNGILEAAMIKAIDPRLAAYNSAYGHNFAGVPPIKTRLVSALGRLRPTQLRRLSFRLKQRYGKHADLSALQTTARSLLPNGYERLAPLFRPQHVVEPGQANRLATLAYFLEKLDLSV